MVEFELKIHEKQGTAYIPKEIRKVLGTNVKAVPNRAALVLYPEGIPVKDVLESLRIIKEDLEHAEKLEKRAAEDE